LRAGAADAGDAGEVFFVPAETVHAVRNVGGGNASELATYVVGKGKPLVIAEAGAVGCGDYRLRRLAAGIPESPATSGVTGRFGCRDVLRLLGSINAP
jgi:hypothetical protein